MDKIYISSSILKQLLPYLKSKGINREEFCRKCGIDKEYFKDSFPVCHKEYLRIVKLAKELIDDINFPLRAGEYFSSEYWVILGYILFHSFDLKDLFRRLKLYSEVLGNYINIDLTVGKRESFISFTINREAEIFSEDCLITTMVSQLKLMKTCLREDIKLERVELGLIEPENSIEFKRVFKCPVEYNLRDFRIYFKSQYLFFPFNHRDSYLLKLFEEHADKILTGLKNSYSIRVEKIISESITREDFSINFVADKLGITQRTLQNRLLEESLSFNQILVNYRIKESKNYLKNGFHSKDISNLLGFSQISSFHRFFKKHNGITPVEYKKKVNELINF